MQQDTSPPSPMPTPIVIPTVSAWSRQEPSAPSLDAHPTPPQGLAAIPLVAVLALVLSYVGFAGIFAYLIVISNARIDRETDALYSEIKKLTQVLAEMKQEQIQVKQEQSLRKEHVLRIPTMGDMISSIQRTIAEQTAALKLIENQYQTVRDEVEKLRRDHDVLVARLNDVTYIRHSKIPVPSKKR